MKSKSLSPPAFFITGVAGFIGSHLAEALLARGDRVLGIDNLSTGRLENVANLLDHPRFHFCRADIMDTPVLDRLASESQTIIHLAAAVGVKLIVERPAYTIQTNITGTEAVLKAALRYGCRVLIASSSEVYGKGARVPFREDDDVLLGPTCKARWAYAASKMVDEFLGLAYQREHGLQVVVFRLFNTVGPRQTGQYGMVLPRFVRQALRNETIEVYGDGTQSRCFCDVSDVARAIVALAMHPKSPGSVFNIGGTEEVSILSLARLVKVIANSRSKIRLVPYSEAYAPGFEDMQRRLPDTSRIRKLLRWRPRIPLHKIINRVVQYERRRLDEKS